jgi:cysteine desulfurase / selenocysteine lyase
LLEPSLAKGSIDVASIRQDFPILQRKVHGKRLVYLDNAATSQKPKKVIDALVNYYSNYNSNIHRSVHELAEESTQAFEHTRDRTRRFINARSNQEIVFTRGTTESINLAARGLVELKVEKGDTILVTGMEHHSNFVPWQQLARESGAKFEIASVTDEGLLDETDLEAKLPNAKIFAFSHTSNVLGTIVDAKRLIRRAHDQGSIVVVDGAQTVPHMPVDVQDLDCDLYAFSSHKMLGPTGVGCLYGKRELLETLPPLLYGGDMIKEVHEEYSTWNELPWKFEAGTSNIADVIALGAAIDYLETIGIQNIRNHDLDICREALDELQKIVGVTVYGPKNPEIRSATISFNIANVHAHDVASILDEDGVAIRSGHHCAQVLMERLGVTSTARASFYLYNGPDDVQALCEAIKRVKRVFD